MVSRVVEDISCRLPIISCPLPLQPHPATLSRYRIFQQHHQEMPCPPPSYQQANNSDDDLQDKYKDCAVTLKVGRSVCGVVLPYRDPAHIGNAFPRDPIHIRPFNNYFSKVKIDRTWIAVGFLPMKINAMNDPKVRYELV